MRTLAHVVALAIAALLVAPAVLADDGWEDGERHTEWDLRSDGFEIISDRVQGAEHDRIRFSLDADSVEVRFDLHRNASATEAEAGVRIRLLRVIEFRDVNGDGAFETADEVKAEHQPDDLNVAGIVAANLTSNGVPGVQVTANYTFRDAPSATFGIRATTFAMPTTFANLALRPVETKIDLLFGAFPYTENDTLPAVELRLQSEVEGAPVAGTDGIGFPAGDINATFGWKSVALVDGVERPVRVTVTETGTGGNETEANVAFAYARGSVIEHDPTVGFTLAADVFGPAALGNPLFYLMGVAAAVAVFGAFAAARKGRKPKEQ